MSVIARDLATAADVLAYLEDTPFGSTRAIPLTGGMGNYVFRLHLKNSYEGRGTLVLKHGKPYLPGNQAFAFSLDRQVSSCSSRSQIGTTTYSWNLKRRIELICIVVIDV